MKPADSTYRIATLRVPFAMRLVSYQKYTVMDNQTMGRCRPLTYLHLDLALPVRTNFPLGAIASGLV
jgi:hypothetical protein